MSEETTERPAASDAPSPYLVPMAIVAGFAMVAVAIYLGLRSGEPAPASDAATAPTSSAPDLSLPEAERGDWVVPSEPPAPSPAPSATGDVPARDPALVHNPGVFNTRFKPLRAKINAVCKPTELVQARERSYHIELPLTLQIAADGTITAARPFAKMRVTADDGSYREATTTSDEMQALTACYAEQLAQRVRFPPATAAGRLDVWVRVLSSVE